jgi:hypothetical protein
MPTEAALKDEFPRCGETDLERRETGSTLNHSNDVGEVSPVARTDTDVRPVGDEEKANGLTKSISLPDLKAVASNALSRTVSRITNRDIVDPGPAPGTKNAHNSPQIN